MLKSFLKKYKKLSVTLLIIKFYKTHHYALNSFFHFFLTILKSKNKKWTFFYVQFYKMEYRIENKNSGVLH